MTQFSASWLASQPPNRREAFLASLTSDELAALEYDWPFWAREGQIAPAGAWSIWIAMAGRGWGKTKTGAEWVRTMAAGEEPTLGALVAATAKDARDVMVEGPAGVLAVSPPWARPEYEPSKARVTWPNGSVAYLYSAEEPERLRGPQFHWAWCDEFAAWKRLKATWDMLQFGMRLGDIPRRLITTTPRPVRLLKDLLADERKGRDGLPRVRVTRGSTYDNRANLAPDFFDEIRSRYEGTRLGRQELSGELLMDRPGALWTLDLIDQHRTQKAPPMRRVVVAIDPPTTSGEDADECGIIAAGVGEDGRGYVLDDRSEGGLSPERWARRAVDLYHERQADTLVAEINQGGEMVTSIIRTIDPNVPVITVHATRGKYLRAEPVSSLYQQGRVAHVGAFARLEDQMSDFSPDYDRTNNPSPDRMDALVYALTELMLGPQAGAPRARSL